MKLTPLQREALAYVGGTLGIRTRDVAYTLQRPWQQAYQLMLALWARGFVAIQPALANNPPLWSITDAGIEVLEAQRV